MESIKIDPFINNINIPSIIGQVFYHWNSLSLFYNSIYLKALDKTIKSNHEYNFLDNIIINRSITKNTSLYEQWLKNIDDDLGIELKKEQFISILSNLVDSSVELRSTVRKAGYPVFYIGWLIDAFIRSFMIFASVPKDYDLSSFEVIYTKGKARLLHYHGINKDIKKNDENNDDSSTKESTPLLIIYAPINRFHIMDLSPEKSVVRNLISNGIDVYLLDWGFPDWNDFNLSLEDYFGYIKDSVDLIKEKSNKEKISILGYCWGGIITLCYASIYNKNISKLAIMAAPVDFSKDITTLSTWARYIDSDKLIKEFGHVDGTLLDLGFLLRNPPRYLFDKYFDASKKLNDYQFINEFILVEKWLHDTPILPGNFYTKIINDCYKNNLLISGKMLLNDDDKEDKPLNDKSIVNLKNIDVPMMIITAEKDDLVSPESTLSIKDHVSSKEIEIINMPGGHVGLCISKYVHENLWPKFSEWILSKE